MASKKDDAVKVGTLNDIPNNEFIGTGFPEVDDVIGGFARRRITQLWGPPGVGKSFLLAKTMASIKGKVLYIDTEFALNKDRLESLGVNLKKIDYIASAELEKITEYVIDNINTYDMVIIDAIAKFTPTTVTTNKVGENSIGLYARQIAHFDAKLRPKLYESNAALVCINQVRSNFGSAYISTKPAGAFAWQHTVDMSLKLFKDTGNKVYKQTAGVKREIGHYCSIKVEKNRLGMPATTTKFLVNY